jgi:very-short-patch-repair endonuclease
LAAFDETIFEQPLDELAASLAPASRGGFARCRARLSSSAYRRATKTARALSLNVAITRARARMTVVSSFSSADMDPNKLNAEGAKMLARYLAYAESGGTDLGLVARDKPELNSFERDVEAQLTGAGIPLVAQFGVSGYWIDFAAQHRSRPGRMVLAIECDGVTYHSSHTARDRDRLRQEHLERLGWTFHRIWSQDWFLRREQEVARAVAAYDAALAAADRSEEDGGPRRPHPGPAVEAVPSATRTRGACPVRLGRANITDYAPSELAALVGWIESDTLLRTEEQLLGEAMHLLGFSRRGTRIVGALKRAIAEGRRGSSRRLEHFARIPSAMLQTS